MSKGMLAHICRDIWNFALMLILFTFPSTGKIRTFTGQKFSPKSFQHTKVR